MSATGELLPNLGVRKFQLSDVPDMDDFNEHLDAIDSQITGTAAGQIANRIYPGVDLSEVFAEEIAGYSDVWAWIKARIQAVDYSGIHVGDYIPFTAGGNAIKAEIAGIDTYYNYGDTAVGHHIDFISRDCWPEAHVFNKVNYNNGTSVSPSPWLASDLYAWLNSLQMQVPNSATANPTLVAVDYRTTGVYDKLPAELKAVIAPKRSLIPSRYTAGSPVNDENGRGWGNIGNLWLPSEIEIFGMMQWGSMNGYATGGFVQYPIFASNSKWIKGAGDGGSRASWWLSTPAGNSFNACTAVSESIPNFVPTSTTNIRVPICFRVA